MGRYTADTPALSPDDYRKLLDGIYADTPTELPVLAPSVNGPFPTAMNRAEYAALPYLELRVNWYCGYCLTKLIGDWHPGWWITGCPSRIRQPQVWIEST